MAAQQTNANGVLVSSNYPTCMESVNRISKLPVVESTIQTATNIYGKVKDYNSVTNWTLTTAESTVNMAVEVGKPIATPVIKNLEGPIKKVDTVLCSGLDYVESKMPAVKLPPSELLLQIYTSTKDYVTNHVTPAVETARSYAEPAIGRARSAMDAVEPALERARNAVEPALERARNAVEPLVEPVVERAQALRENVMQKVDEYLHRGHEHDGHEGDALECEECKQVRQKLIEEEERKQQERTQS
ncbi:unnamed protein product [Phaedon cochleariae]|uniref:Uncharacterized protein n=1 Tax=Phaedon cochleariae TaxID=80249 RepID=A0A9P0DK32_PHACE|nr:unnamed protein product [Phaedon cochleariae]